MRALFISDLHLDANDTATHARFDAFMREVAPGADALYVLGDLLHLWLGDALLARDHYAARICASFQQLAQSGTRIFIARGNRDFMIGAAFAGACGAALIDAETVIQLGQQRILLMHGDELCTDDTTYQRARRVLRSPLFRALGDRLPQRLRAAIASRLRRASDKHKAHTAMPLMDANAHAIDQAMQRHQVSCLIHGHTHRPGHHQLSNHRERWVLSDWQQRFGYLQWQDGQFSTHPWPTAARTATDTSL